MTAPGSTWANAQIRVPRPMEELSTMAVACRKNCAGCNRRGISAHSILTFQTGSSTRGACACWFPPPRRGQVPQRPVLRRERVDQARVPSLRAQQDALQDQVGDTTHVLGRLFDGNQCRLVHKFTGLLDRGSGDVILASVNRGIPPRVTIPF